MNCKREIIYFQYNIMNNPPSKTEWKRIMNNAVNNTIKANWDMDIKKKTSLKYINKDSLKVSKCHHVRTQLGIASMTVGGHN